tara:strand:- start:10 stop:255 length:246 start_codon:yes stop_codon:yes gene_type:complete
MSNLKETFLKRYGVWEYVLFLIGLGMLGRVLYSVIIADFKNMTIEEIGVIILFFALGILAIAAPLTLLDFARKKAGMQTRE